MKRFSLGLLGFVVVWIAGLAPQFLAYAHVSGIKSKANTTKAAERNSGKTKRAIIKDLQPTAKAGQKVVGGASRLGRYCA